MAFHRLYAQVESFDPSRTPVHVATASGAGAGKTTFTNKLIAELIASRARLRAVLPRHLHGDLAPHELPGKGTKMDDVLRLFREGHGEAHEGLQGLRRFSCTIKPLKPAQAIREGGAAQAPDQSPSGVGADESPFAEGGKYDYFQPERHGVTEDVLAQVSCTWDDAVHVGKVGNRYNMCRPHVGDQKYGCFMPDGRGGHCTDRVQHVYMSVADTLDEAAFRFRWQLISREEANKQIHQVRGLLLSWGCTCGSVAHVVKLLASFSWVCRLELPKCISVVGLRPSFCTQTRLCAMQYRQHIKGELAYGEIDPEAHINVPYMCGLNDDKVRFLAISSGPCRQPIQCVCSATCCRFLSKTQIHCRRRLYFRHGFRLMVLPNNPSSWQHGGGLGMCSIHIAELDYLYVCRPKWPSTFPCLATTAAVSDYC